MKSFTFLATAIAFALLSSYTFAQNTQFRNGLTHTGVYNGSVFNNVQLHWQFATGGAIRSTPLAVNGKIYVGSGDHYLYCLDTTGKQLWKLEAEAGVHSSPAVVNGIVYFNDRNNNLYAVTAADGKLAWKKQLGKTPAYEWSFDYYIASPLVTGNMLYTGSGDGNLYALNVKDGSIQWKYNAGSIIRSTPAFHNNKLVFGDCDGRIYSVNAIDGKAAWVLKLNGDTMHNENYGFDRKAVIAAPAIANNMVVVGDRAGYLYGINETTGAKLWQLDYEVTWILSSVAVKDSMIVTGTSDGAYINAVNLYTGKEIWRFQTQAPVWASPVITGNTVMCPSNDGVLYGLDVVTGKETWRYAAGERYFGSPVVDGDKVYVGNDDGRLYCFTAAPKASDARKVVFWMKEPPFQSFQFGVDRYIKDYFRTWGYEVMDETKLPAFLQEMTSAHKKSVVVFATNYFPPSITGDSTQMPLLLSYLKAGGKAVVCAMNPAVYQMDSANKQITALDFTRAKKILDINYNFNDTRAFNGFYPSVVTKEGKQWGLKNGYVSRLGQPDNVVNIVLMRDETGKATSWVKTYGGATGTGFVQTWIFPSTLQNISELKSLAEYGLQ